jgi:cell fate regulator YaaT (PSP1 superfamily)
VQDEIEVVGIKYKQNSKIYYFSPRNLDLEINDEVLVDTANGVVNAIVAMKVKKVSKSEIEEPLKNVIRKLTDKDRAQIERNKKRAEESKPVIMSKINALGLPMNLTDVEYTFDESKVTISYTSDDRVDFRELLKVLASTLRVKIELRQISTREEVKSVGALGLCGRECCCTKFLNEPAHVVVKMAKLQNLSMSPTKTGGACGRMMCCLAYEEPVYKEMQEKMPKVGSKITTPDGEGVVQYNNLLKGLVTVKIFQNDDSYKIQEFSLKELGFETENETGGIEIAQLQQKSDKGNEQSQKLVANEELKEYNISIDGEKNVAKSDENHFDEKSENINKNKEHKNFNRKFGFNKTKFNKFKNHNNNHKKGEN